MVFTASFKVTWSWYYILLLFYIMTKQNCVQALDEDFKKTLLDGFENLLKEQLSDFNNKLTQMNSTLGNIKEELARVAGTVNDMESKHAIESEKFTRMDSTLGIIKEEFARLGGSLNGIKSDELVHGDSTLEVIKEELARLGGTINAMESNHFIQSNNVIESDKLTQMESTLGKMNNELAKISETVTAIDTDKLTKINFKLNHMKTTMVNIKQDHTILEGTVKSIASNVEGIEVRFSEPLNQIKSQAATMTDELNSNCKDLSKNMEKIDKKTTEFENLLLNSIITENVDAGCPESLKSPQLAMEENISRKMVTIDRLEQSIETDKLQLRSIKCSEGFMVSTECFKIFKDQKRSWAGAKIKCESRGLHLAEPSDSVAVPLRKHLLDNYGDGETWLGSKGDGSYMRWLSNRQQVAANSSLWWPSSGVQGGSNQCLMLLATTNSWRGQPEKPYWTTRCTNIWYTLCQIPLE